MTKVKTSASELTITRTFEAPVETVWRFWTEPDLFVRWWGPKVFTSPYCTMDLRVGGKYLWCMRDSEGKDYWSTGVFREIVPHERLVYTDAFADEKGNIVPPEEYGMTGEWPKELLVTVTFEEYDGGTKMTLHHTGLPAGEMRDLAGQGWNESFDKLAATMEAME